MNELFLKNFESKLFTDNLSCCRINKIDVTMKSKYKNDSLHEFFF
jgi:hypothetical protein